MADKKKHSHKNIAEAFIRNDFNVSATARELGYVSRSTLREHLKVCREKGLIPNEVTFNLIPSALAPIAKIIEKQKSAFSRKKAAGGWRNIHWIDLAFDGPFMISFLGDEHVDDDGTDLEDLEYWISHLDVENRKYGFSLGDWSNNWLRFLGFLWGQQEVTDDESFELVKHYVDLAGPHLVGSVGGNHDKWNGGERALQAALREHGVPHKPDGLRIGFRQPGAKNPVTIGARHNFPGTSIYNAAHGVMRAALFGWRDDVLVGGDKHISGNTRVKDPDNGRLTMCEQVASFKKHDRYADECGFQDKHVTPAVAFVFRPWLEQTDPRRVTRFDDPADASAFLELVRAEYEA
jgi:hypothetical protein